MMWTTAIFNILKITILTYVISVFHIAGADYAYYFENFCELGEIDIRGKDTGTIQSGTSDIDPYYTNNLDCQVTVTTSEDQRIRITWLDFDIDDGFFSCDDTLKIYDGRTVRERQLNSGHECGEDTRTPPTFESSTNNLRFWLETDWSVTGNFKFKYEAFAGDNNDSGDQPTSPTGDNNGDQPTSRPTESSDDDDEVDTAGMIFGTIGGIVFGIIIVVVIITVIACFGCRDSCCGCLYALLCCEGCGDFGGGGGVSNKNGCGNCGGGCGDCGGCGGCGDCSF